MYDWNLKLDEKTQHRRGVTPRKRYWFVLLEAIRCHAKGKSVEGYLFPSDSPSLQEWNDK
jgi:hypothetical protein